MKSFIISLISISLLITNGVRGQQPTIYAIVNEDIVTLWEIGALRNCGADYDMQAYLDDHLLKWYQHDQGDIAWCLCVFDLSVTYGPLEPGDYTANVYYTFPDDPTIIFEGSVDFHIDSLRGSPASGVISQYQSDCYSGVGIDNTGTVTRKPLMIYPSPARLKQTINVEVTNKNETTLLEIFTSTGEKVYTREYGNLDHVHDRLLTENIFQAPGLYIARLKSRENIYSMKIMVLP